MKSNIVNNTSQQLGSLIKSSRDIMRKDKGLNGDLDRLPMLTWIMFLKFLDDMERLREEEAKVAGKKFRPVIEQPYRWRDWATKEDGITGDELISFVNNDEAILPNGNKGLGLFAYLRGLQGSNSGERRDVVATVFKGITNRMINGYLLRDVINKVNGIHFTSSKEINTLGHLYETMLKEMRDSAGDSGEFYTPRPVVRFMVEVTNPRLGETVLDPACGTGGFLAESYSHLEKQCDTVEDYNLLQSKSIYGGEAKPLPYLLVQMNLLLHGLEFPQIDPFNSLRYELREIGAKDRVDIILTNPPFGGEEERGILGNFPKDKQTSETALLFLQLIMRKLKRPGENGENCGRAAVLVPNGTLYNLGIASRIRQELIEDFNLHTVVRLPKGVFEPYADIPTNILFFDRCEPTKDIWFYQHPLPPSRASLRSPCYSMSDPLTYEEFMPLIKWWSNRTDNEYAWKVAVSRLAEADYNLDQKNPWAPKKEKIDLSTLKTRINKHAEEMNASFSNLDQLLEQMEHFQKISADAKQLQMDTLNNLCDVVKGSFPTKKTNEGQYRFVVTAAERRTADSYQFDGPAICIPLVSSTGHGHASIHRIHYEEGKFALANIMAALIVKPGTKLLPKYLFYYLWRFKDDKLVSLMAGTANTSFSITKLKTVTISYPSLPDQQAVVDFLDDMNDTSNHINKALASSAGIISEYAKAALVTSFVQ